MFTFENPPPSHELHDAYNFCDYFTYIPTLTNFQTVASYAKLTVGIGALCYLFSRCRKKNLDAQIHTEVAINTETKHVAPIEKRKT